ncbi:MAG: pre-peptidase C-terminal domain-containing protein [Chthonomonadaceae bacterium]|nr:pre-peptidase C-terminal domain-containing protein [Chthonomonadaceae bacterium]
MFVSLLASMANLVVEDVLPDVSLLPSYLAQAFVTTSNPELPGGTKALRFPTASVNYGPGRLELRGGEVSGNQQRVYQRVYRSDNTTYDRAAGWFIYHPSHGHIHFESWTQFILRKRNKDNGVGEIVGTGAKTSFCILEIVEWDNTLGGHNTQPSYSSCGQLQGLRPGWADVYGSSLDGQYINLTGIPDGEYWLEGFIDPNGQVIETNEANNHVLVPLSIGTAPGAQPDAFENNNSIAEVDSKPESGVNSPNFGLLKGIKELKKLSMNDSQDWFKFRMGKTGTSGDYVRIQSSWMRTGDLDLQLYNSAGTLLASSTGAYNYEQISLSGRAAGTYYVKVVRATTTNNPNYWLTIDPAGPTPPIVKVDGQQTEGATRGTTYVQKAYETIPMSWQYDSEKSSATDISIFKSRTKDASDGVVVDGLEGLPGHVKSVNILTNQFEVGKWNIFARFRKGGGHVDLFKQGSIIVYRKGDVDFDGKVTVNEAQTLYHDYLKAGKELPEGWDKICDMDDNGQVNMKDYQLMYLTAEHGE